jgi:hypothetical protein
MQAAALLHFRPRAVMGSGLHVATRIGWEIVRGRRLHITTVKDGVPQKAVDVRKSPAAADVRYKPVTFERGHIGFHLTNALTECGGHRFEAVPASPVAPRPSHQTLVEPFGTVLEVSLAGDHIGHVEATGTAIWVKWFARLALGHTRG